MRRFRFRLDRLERLRHLERRESEVALAQAVSKVDALRSRAERLEIYATEVARDIRNGLRKGETVSGESVRNLADQIEEAREMASRARKLERAALKELSLAEQRHLEKSRAHRVLERLHQRKKKLWVVETEREEQRLLDELHVLQLGGSGLEEGTS